MNAPVSFFASYSRRDKSYVEPVVDLLRSGAVRVFVDRDNIQPGDRWEMVLERNLESAATLLVFWSKNARKSDWVQREWTEAIKANKRLIPVLLDQTALPNELSAYQYIDFRHFRKRSPLLPVFGLFTIFGLGSTAYLWMNAINAATTTTRDFGPTPFSESYLGIACVVTSILVILTLAAALVRKWRKARQSRELAKDIAQAVKV